MRSYQGKKIAVVGLSVEGTDSLQFFLSEKSLVTVCDRRSEEELHEAVTPYAKQGVSFQFGSACLSNLNTFDYVIRTPGISPHTPEFVEAQKHGAVLSSQTNVFLEECPCPVIGVTGTKGKGTTSSLIFEMLRKSGRTAYLGGNVGTPLLSKVRSIKKTDWVVLELSSFQLEDCAISPHIAVVLRIGREHLANFDPLASNFHQTVEAYRTAKSQIVKHQKKDDIVVYNADDPVSASFAKLTPAKQYSFSLEGKPVDAFVADNTVFLKTAKGNEQICDIRSIHMRGRHNLENIAAAGLGATGAGISVDVIRQISRQFPGLPYRLEDVGTVHGVLFVNDSFSTIPETTIAALLAFDQPIVLIAGGSEKKSDFTGLGVEIAKRNVRSVIAVGAMTGRIVQALTDAGYTGHIITGLTTMHDMVGAAVKESRPGDVVLLSPACASFGLFKNYKERGNQFSYEVSEYKKHFGI